MERKSKKTQQPEASSAPEPSHPLFRCGTVSIVGRPNVGKSTLLNHIVGEKVAIVSEVPQTTRNQVRGIYTEERGQIIFIDTPGFHKNKDKLDQFMNKTALGTTLDTDCIIHLVDCGDPVGPEEEAVVRKLASLTVPVVLGLNKVDITDKFIPEYISLWEKVTGKPVTQLERFVILPLSGKTGMNTQKLLDVLFEFLLPGPALYPEDVVCDIPQRMAVADIIREKFFQIMRQEVPHSLAVLIEDMQPKRHKVVHIRALVLVERDSQKNIVIGKNGQVLKEVGTLARQELEDLMDVKVFLELFVKSKRNWRQDNSLLVEMGYYESR
ncbi:MAG: GTPase Era [Candidatus Omnitrophota bacterium]|jgi:GTP-binding protein Era